MATGLDELHFVQACSFFAPTIAARNYVDAVDKVAFYPFRSCGPNGCSQRHD